MSASTFSISLPVLLVMTHIFLLSNISSLFQLSLRPSLCIRSDDPVSKTSCSFLGKKVSTFFIKLDLLLFLRYHTSTIKCFLLAFGWKRSPVLYSESQEN